MSVAAIIGVLGLLGPLPERFQYSQVHMGVEVRVTLYAPDAETAQRATRAAFERFAELDAICSDYRKDSELSLLCAQAGGEPIPVSNELYTLLERSEEVSKLSDGAFDITCGPLIRLWREARKTKILPTTKDENSPHHTRTPASSTRYRLVSRQARPGNEDGSPCTRNPTRSRRNREGLRL